MNPGLSVGVVGVCRVCRVKLESTDSTKNLATLHANPVWLGTMSNPYEAACIAANMRPRKNILDAYEAAASMEEGAELKCSGRKLEEGRMLDVDMSLLGEAMLKPHPFALLDLSYNELGDGAAEALKNLLASDTRLLSLDLTCNELVETSCAAIFEGLKGNKTLRELRLSGNKLGDKAGMALAELLQTNDTLQRLYLGNCELKMESLVALATVLQQNASVTVLDVQRSLVSSRMEEHVEHFGRLLAVGTSLKELDLSKCGVSDRGLLMLMSALRKAGGSSALRVLKLRANQIRLVDAGAIDVLGLLLGSPDCALQSLDLTANDLRDDGALVLAEMVQNNGSLLQLHLGNNSINSRGLCALAHAVAINQGLQAMTLWGNRFDSAACLAWKPGIAKLALDFRTQEVDGTFMPVQV